MTAKLIFTHGLPGSGKSTWAQKQVDADPDNRVRVNRDDLRTELFGEKYHEGNFPAKDESVVTQHQLKRLKEALAAGKTVYCDDTNLGARTVGKLAKIGLAYGATIEQQVFDVPVKTCHERNRARGAAGGRKVPGFVIKAMAKNAYDEDGNIKDFIITAKGDAFVVAKLTEGGRLIEEFNSKASFDNPFIGQAVVLLDVDGTLADNRHQSNQAFGRPNVKDFDYFFKSVNEAKVNESVRDLANAMRENDGLNIVVLTGRDDSAAAELIAFLKRSRVKVSRVIVKRDGDGRTDAEFKDAEIDRLEAEGFVIVHSIDDRARSIRIAEKRGIMVSRVPEHISEDPDNAPSEYPPLVVNTIYGSGACIRCGQPLKKGNIGPKCLRK